MVWVSINCSISWIKNGRLGIVNVKPGAGIAEKSTYTFAMPFVEDAIAAAIYTVQYVDSMNAKPATSAGKRAFDSTFELASRLLELHEDVDLPLSVLIASEPVQSELKRQQRAVELLKSAKPNAEVVGLLRTDAQKVGQKFQTQIQWHLEHYDSNPYATSN